MVTRAGDQPRLCFLSTTARVYWFVAVLLGLCGQEAWGGLGDLVREFPTLHLHFLHFVPEPDTKAAALCAAAAEHAEARKTQQTR